MATTQAPEGAGVTPMGADEAVADARYYIAMQFSVIARSLGRVSVLRNTAGSGWVVRLVDLAGRRTFEATHEHQDGSWDIGYERDGPRTGLAEAVRVTRRQRRAAWGLQVGIDVLP